MRVTGRVLIVDDDQAFLDMYQRILANEGYVVETATSREAAIARLDEDDWDVVLLDQKLLGPGGPDQGIELITETQARAPGAKPIMVTAFASEIAIERAFDRGVYDYLEKKGAFSALLRAKVRNAVEAVRERTLRHMRDDDAERAIRALFEQLDAEADPNRKGLVLEQLMMLLIGTIDGFHDVRARRRNQDEEIDIQVRNESSDPLWAKESPYFLFECKNWSRPAGAPELSLFQQKLERRFGRVTLGFFVAAAGFTQGFFSQRQAERRGDVMMVLIGPDQLRELVHASDRNHTLKALHSDALVEASGGSA